MINLAPPKDCTACHACVNVCPQHAVSMTLDSEGFLQPVINRDVCIGCGLCQKKCPALNRNDEQPSGQPLKQRAFALISAEDRTVSSSGGAFSVFGRIVLKRGGVVYGATQNESLQCYHIGVERVEDLSLLRGSKYVQSRIGDVFREIKKHLLNNRMVLFSGTPCQVAGLYSFLGKRYEGLLITLDIICHGVPNQKTFDSYIKKLNHVKQKNVKSFSFRKKDSWSLISSVVYSDGKNETLYLSDNAFMNAFFQGSTFRESCFHCQYCNINRIGTFTIADFWGLGGKGERPFRKNVAKGVSLVIDNLGAINQYMHDIQQLAYIEERSVTEAVKKQHNLKSPMRRPPERNYAIELMNDDAVCLEDFSKRCNLPYRKTLNNRMIIVLKKFLFLFGLYNIYKTISYKMGKTS